MSCEYSCNVLQEWLVCEWVSFVCHMNIHVMCYRGGWLVNGCLVCYVNTDVIL